MDLSQLKQQTLNNDAGYSLMIIRQEPEENSPTGVLFVSRHERIVSFDRSALGALATAVAPTELAQNA
jgi:hypothetical protein